jgi:hypothetical protein
MLKSVDTADKFLGGHVSDFSKLKSSLHQWDINKCHEKDLSISISAGRTFLSG